MRKILFSIATVFATSFTFGQINLEHSYQLDEAVLNYSDSQDLKYVSLKDSQITVYNSDYSVYKTFKFPQDFLVFIYPLMMIFHLMFQNTFSTMMIN